MGSLPQQVRRKERSLSHPGTVIAEVNDLEIVDCRACGFVHVRPMPLAEALLKAYRDDYYLTTKPTYLAHAADDAGWANLHYDDRLDQLADLLPVEERRLLDIGAGPGLFLERAILRGWEGVGIEPSRQASEFARGRGLNILTGFFTDEIVADLGAFSAVHLMNMLEHVPDAIDVLARAAHLLRPGGVMCVGVPNDFSPFQKLLSERRGFKPWWIAPPHHLNYFNFESLERVLRRTGLTPVARLTSFPMEFFAIFGANYVGDEVLGKACHHERKAFDADLEHAAPGARRRFYRKLAEAGIGREAIVFAVKDAS